MAKTITLARLIASKFVQPLKSNNYKTIVKPTQVYGSVSGGINIHISNRKKHIIRIWIDASDTRLLIKFESQRLRHIYDLYDRVINPADPKFTLDFIDPLAAKIVKFMGHMDAIEKHLEESHNLFEAPKYSRNGYNPSRGKKGNRKVSRTGV